MRKVWKVLGLVVALMLIALPAMAQDGGDSGGAANALVTVGFLSVSIAWVLEWVRTKWATLDGDILRLAGLVIGIVLAFVFELDISADLGLEGLADPLGTIATGLAIAGVTGLFGTAKNAMRGKDPESSINTDNA